MRISDWSSDVCSSDLDGRNGGFQVLQRQIKLVRIGPLGFAPEGGLPEGGNQFFQSFDPLVLTSFTRRRGDQQRLQGSNVIEKIGSLRHAPSLPNPAPIRSEEHTSELQSLMRTSYAVFCLKKKITTAYQQTQ